MRRRQHRGLRRTQRNLRVRGLLQLLEREHAAALLKARLYRRWGIKTAREYARIKIDGLRLVGGNPDFTTARSGRLGCRTIRGPPRAATDQDRALATVNHAEARAKARARANN